MYSSDGHAVIQSSRMPILTIPSMTEGSAAFKQRLAVLIRAQSTHIYIDSSFLVWMTKIGSNSRQELIRWPQQNCTGRIHVPIWAAHEYLKHHVAGTIVTELAKKTNEISDLVGRTYTYFRPFIGDRPLSRRRYERVIQHLSRDASGVRYTRPLTSNRSTMANVLPKPWLRCDFFH